MVVFRLMLKLNSMSSNVNEAHAFSIRTLCGATARNDDDDDDHQHQHQHQKQPHFWLPLMNDIDKTIFNFAFWCALSPLALAFVRSSPLESASVHSYTQHDLDLNIHVCVASSILKSIALNAHYERISPNKCVRFERWICNYCDYTWVRLFWSHCNLHFNSLFARSISLFPLNDSNGE